MTLPPLEPVFPVPVILGLTGLAALLALGRAFFGRPLRPAWLQGPVLLLRWGAIALVAIFLLNPSDPILVKVPESQSLVLLDESASMSLGAPSRWEEAGQWLQQFRAGMQAAGQEPPALAVFAANVEPVKSLEGRQPVGNESRLGGAIERLIANSGTTPPDHLIVISDGQAQDRTVLPAALAQARARGVGISTLAVGSDSPARNAGIAAVTVPRVVRSNSRVNVTVELAAGGYKAGEPLSLVLKDENGNRIGGAELRAPAAGAAPAETVLSFDAGVRTAHYTLELAADPRDVAPDDNRFDFTVEVATSKLRVLFVEGTHVKRSVGTTGYWWNDMELMTRAWDATGEIDYVCLTPVSEYINSPNLVGVTFANGEMIPDKTKDFPKTREELYRFDVMMISDVPVGNFSTEQMEWVVDWITERGGGFLMGGGYTSFDVGNYDKTPWERITPVDMLAFGDGFNEQRFKIEIPKAVRKHPTWRIVPDLEKNEEILATHPDFTGMNRVKRAKPGAIVLMTRPDMNNEPVIAAQQYGRGRSIAYLGDPNGGWAKFLVSWGPPGGPPQGPHTELGHGERFKVNVAATKSASGPPPPHPAPYYAQYWINVVKWLGENSVRWRRDKLAGNIATTLAQPGHALPVAAEVLAVTDREALLALNVGARLDQPGSPRVRLEYDRDRREFIGQLPIPADFPGGEVNVLFDTMAAGQSLTDAVRVGVRHANREFSESAPDRPFLAELAKVGGGRVITSVAEAVEVCREAAAKRARESQRKWTQPAWTNWPWWAALAVLLCLEWALRRRAATNAAVAAGAVLVLFTLPAEGQTLTSPEAPKVEKIETSKGETATAAEIAALVEQLGAARVRLRDEAEAKLKKTPAALAAVKAALAGSPSLEIRLRARNVSQALRESQWQQEMVAQGHRTQPRSMACKIVASPDGKRFFTRGEDFVRAWNAETSEAGVTFGAACGTWQDWQRGGPMWSLALSPDGRRVVSTNSLGRIFIHNAEDGAELLQFDNVDRADTTVARINFRTLWNIAFFPDGRTFATADRGGLVRIWNTDAGTLVKSIPADPSHVVRALAISPDGNLIACSTDLGNAPNKLMVWNIERGEWIHVQVTATRTFTLAFSRDGRTLLGEDYNGAANLWSVGADGALGEARRIGMAGDKTIDVAFSSDEKSIFAVGDGAAGQLTQWDVATGEELWRSPRLEQGLAWVSVLGPDRVVTLGNDEKVRIWQRQAVPGKN